jgi:hypothetical protein
MLHDVLRVAKGHPVWRPSALRELLPRQPVGARTDGAACTRGDTCLARGDCTGTPLVCDTPPQLAGTDPRHAACISAVGICGSVTATGAPICTYETYLVGTACYPVGTDMCTTGATCRVDGTCMGGSVNQCLPAPECRVGGASVCARGSCDYTPVVTTFPPTACRGGSGTCRYGECHPACVPPCAEGLGCTFAVGAAVPTAVCETPKPGGTFHDLCGVATPSSVQGIFDVLGTCVEFQLDKSSEFRSDIARLAVFGPPLFLVVVTTVINLLLLVFACIFACLCDSRHGVGMWEGAPVATSAPRKERWQ